MKEQARRAMRKSKGRGKKVKEQAVHLGGGAAGQVPFTVAGQGPFAVAGLTHLVYSPFTNLPMENFSHHPIKPHLGCATPGEFFATVFLRWFVPWTNDKVVVGAHRRLPLPWWHRPTF